MAAYPTDNGRFRRRNRQPIAKWQQFVLLAYVLLLTFILPFICWGVWADPGHPHGSPHLVFAAPPSPSDSLNQIVWSLQSYCGSPRAEAPAAPQGEAASAPIAGQSLPDTTLVIVSLLMIFAGWLLLERLRPSTERAFRPCTATPFTPIVPTPPPRPDFC